MYICSHFSKLLIQIFLRHLRGSITNSFTVSMAIATTAETIAAIIPGLPINLYRHPKQLSHF
jgi:hypothetical protein